MPASHGSGRVTRFGGTGAGNVITAPVHSVWVVSIAGEFTSDPAIMQREPTRYGDDFFGSRIVDLESACCHWAKKSPRKRRKIVD